MFTHLLYLPFLAVSALIYWLLPTVKIKRLLLTVLSLAVVCYLDPKASLVVVILTIATFLSAKVITVSRNKKLAHRSGVIGLLLVLAVFKYLGFLTGTLSSLLNFISKLPSFRIDFLYLPLGLSYLIFKYISYLTDIYWGISKKGDLLDLFCFGTLFTTFTAGPIERFIKFKPQLDNLHTSISKNDLIIGMERIIFGFFKKLVLADWLSIYINPVWQNPAGYSAMARIIALVGFSLQIYLDFSGYSDIAIGSSRLFGLRIIENFNSPYLAVNISQFWRRWHISLSDWIRDYLFFPLAQGKKNRFWLIFCVPLIAMGLCGLWHGSAWNYVVWGLWHGLGIAVLQYWNLARKSYSLMRKLTAFKGFYYIGLVITFVFVSIGWIFFNLHRVDGVAGYFQGGGDSSLPLRSQVVVISVFLLYFAYHPIKSYIKHHLETRLYCCIRLFTIFVMIWSIVSLPADSSPFLYAGF